MNALALFLFAAPLVQDPQILDARIDTVTVYPRSAHVHRSSEVVTVDGNYVIEGLTNDLDRSKVRVKCDHGEIVRRGLARLGEAAHRHHQRHPG